MILFNFAEMGGKGDEAVKKIIAEFKKNGVTLVKNLVSVSPVKRSSGVSFKEITMTTSDSRQVQFAVKQTGDIFKVKLSVIQGQSIKLQEMPIKNQSDHSLAIKEICTRIDRERKPYQAKLEKIQSNELDPKIKNKMAVSVRSTEKSLLQEIAELDKAIKEAEDKLAELEAKARG